MDDGTNDFMLMCVWSHSPGNNKDFVITTIDTFVMKITNCASHNHQIFTIAILRSVTVSLYGSLFNTFVFSLFVTCKFDKFLRVVFPFVDVPTYLVFLFNVLWGGKKMLVFRRNHFLDNAQYAVKPLV